MLTNTSGLNFFAYATRLARLLSVSAVLVMYTSTWLYSSSFDLQYCAIFNVKSASLKPYLHAPGSEPPCPGSSTTTRFGLAVDCVAIPLSATLSSASCKASVRESKVISCPSASSTVIPSSPQASSASCSACSSTT